MTDKVPNSLRRARRSAQPLGVMLRTAIPPIAAAIFLAACVSPRGLVAPRDVCVASKGYCSAEDCSAAGGTIKVAGFSGKSICDLPSRDGGNACSNAADCEGFCYADPHIKVGERATGHCSVSATYFYGCAPGGRIEHGEVVDDAICID